eukprot:TRINITY_DN56384_c0_g1_i1.p1 TRINITY_DN56384_c0_g1~~TRINITY_DN56384_c0_g1_i1.p1  ORF type:complete len:623 (+),score=65.90 TRINITY_DN56384_c0_g1_i1:58-1926(+)
MVLLRLLSHYYGGNELIPDSYRLSVVLGGAQCATQATLLALYARAQMEAGTCDGFHPWATSIGVAQLLTALVLPLFGWTSDFCSRSSHRLLFVCLVLLAGLQLASFFVEADALWYGISLPAVALLRCVEMQRLKLLKQRFTTTFGAEPSKSRLCCLFATNGLAVVLAGMAMAGASYSARLGNLDLRPVAWLPILPLHLVILHGTAVVGALLAALLCCTYAPRDMVELVQHTDILPCTVPNKRPSSPCSTQASTYLSVRFGGEVPSPRPSDPASHHTPALTAAALYANPHAFHSTSEFSGTGTLPIPSVTTKSTSISLAHALAQRLLTAPRGSALNDEPALHLEEDPQASWCGEKLGALYSYLYICSVTLLRDRLSMYALGIQLLLAFVKIAAGDPVAWRTIEIIPAYVPLEEEGCTVDNQQALLQNELFQNFVQSCGVIAGGLFFVFVAARAAPYITCRYFVPLFVILGACAALVLLVSDTVALNFAALAFDPLLRTAAACVGTISLAAVDDSMYGFFNGTLGFLIAVPHLVPFLVLHFSVTSRILLGSFLAASALTVAACVFVPPRVVLLHAYVNHPYAAHVTDLHEGRHDAMDAASVYSSVLSASSIYPPGGSAASTAVQ